VPDIRTLVRGQRYCVVREFTDYDGHQHLVGETWYFVGTTFVPYHDGLTLHVLVQGLPLGYRFQQVPEEQQDLLSNFTDYVAPC
jgi:hypothetical protein